MAKVDTLIEGYKRFHKKFFNDESTTFKELYEKGQSPKTLVIACSDSRVDPSIILDTNPGDIFVIRNIANLVPPYEEDDTTCHGTSAAIEYAVNHLKVENIVVLGHSQCGGITAMINQDEKSKTFSFIDKWVKIAKQAKENAKSKTLCTEQNISCLCEKEAIKLSISNLETFPFVKSKVDSGDLTLHGWYFSLENGFIEIIN